MLHLINDAPWWFWPAHMLLPVLWVFVASLLAAWVQWRLSSRALAGLSAEAHWTERARLLWPARRVLAMGTLMGLVCWGFSALVFIHTPVGVWSRAVLTLVCLAAAWCGGVAFSLRLARRQRPWTLWGYLRGVLATLLLRMPHLAVVGVVMLLVSSEMSAWQWGLYVVGVLVALVLAVRGGLPVLRGLGLARRPSARVMGVVAETAARVGVTPRHVWEVDWPVANALAYILTQEVVITADLQEVLNDAELGSVIAHELGHLSEPRRVVLARLTPVVALVVVLLLLPLALQGYVWFYLGSLVCLLVVVMVTGRVRRQMEERADEFGQAHEEDAGTYARALEKIYQHNMVPAVLGLKRAAHPDLYDRLEGAGVTPDYPRPDPPPVARLARLAGVAVHLVMLVMLVLPPFFLPPSDVPPSFDALDLLSAEAREPSVNEPLAWAHLALGGDRFGALVDLGRAASVKGDVALAIRFNLALDELEEHTNPTVTRSRVHLLVSARRCAEAREALLETQQRRDERDDPVTTGLELPLSDEWKLVEGCQPLGG